MKTKALIILAAIALSGCATHQGGTSNDAYYDRGTDTDVPTDFGRGGNRANPPPYDTQSGALLRGYDNQDVHGMNPSKFPPPPPPPPRQDY